MQGDQVDEFQRLCEVQSDKATIEITSRYKGKVAQTLYVPGDIIKVFLPLQTLIETLRFMNLDLHGYWVKTCWLDYWLMFQLQVGETLLKMTVEDFQAPARPGERLDSLKSIDSEQNKQNIGGVLSTPTVRDLAKQYGVNINDILGTGNDGRVLKDDILKYATEKGIIEDSSKTSTADIRHESCSYASAGVEQNYEDKTVSLR